MAEDVEITTLNLRYACYRMRDAAQEGRLLAAISQRGIEEPLEGVDIGNEKVLLNGFKRYRCAKKLGLGIVPYVSLGQDEAVGILALLKTSNAKGLSILEQAGFVDELKQVHQLGVAEIAEHLCRSKAWVSVRAGLIGEMTETIREKLFSGAFPVYPYMYALRRFMRINGVGKREVEEFVVALSGKRLSVRDVEQLAQGYFRGPPSLREQIRTGHLALPLARLREAERSAAGCGPFEQILLNDLQLAQKYMQRVMGKSRDRRLMTPAFYAEASLLTGGLLGQLSAFSETLKELDDRARQTASDRPFA